MGAIADGIMAYGRPLIDATDGSIEQLNKAMALIQLCYNLALTPEDKRETVLLEMQSSLHLTVEEFDEFRNSVVIPMIRRHEEMFPLMHKPRSSGPWVDLAPPRSQPRVEASGKASPEPDRYAPCPCNSGEKYKFCCGKKRR